MLGSCSCRAPRGPADLARPSPTLESAFAWPCLCGCSQSPAGAGGGRCWWEGLLCSESRGAGVTPPARGAGLAAPFQLSRRDTPEDAGAVCPSCPPPSGPSRTSGAGQGLWAWGSPRVHPPAGRTRPDWGGGLTERRSVRLLPCGPAPLCAQRAHSPSDPTCPANLTGLAGLGAPRPSEGFWVGVLTSRAGEGRVGTPGSFRARHRLRTHKQARCSEMQ